ncbi:hypothetical protein AA0114_g7704 [Alternaria tenuissima]|uniref:Uncharacterized protein n=1 Tax=Alternaria tenuissima TaxID=119927 RepID=A0A4Q4MDJ9_9PLEO|nr:hypothetical protein AA0114_g7704 [Alternaria tenuissima]
MAPLQATLHERSPRDTTAATISPTQFDQPAETATLKTPSPAKAKKRHTYIWQCCYCGFRRIMSALSFRRKQDKDNMWEPKVRVYVVVGNDEISRTITALLDPQCHENLISTGCLHDSFPEVVYDTLVGVPIGTSITGREDYLSISTIDIRWTGCDDRALQSNKGLCFRPRVESSTCHVVESEEFDLIIGRPTIDKCKLFKRNRIIAAFRGINPSAKSENVDSDQQDADARREKAKEYKKLREKEKEDARKPTK